MFVLAQSTTVGTSAAVGTSIVTSLISLAIGVVVLIAAWKVFTKAGRPGWACLIPIYNTIVMLQITGHSGWWILGLFVPLLNFFVVIRLVFNLASVFGRGIGFGFGLLFLSPIFLCILAFDASIHYVGPHGRGAGQLPSTGDLAAAAS